MNIGIGAEAVKHLDRSAKWREGWFVGVTKAGIPGCTEGYRQLLRQVLVRRFKKLTPMMEELLAIGSRDEMECWAKRFASGGTLNEIFSEAARSWQWDGHST